MCTPQSRSPESFSPPFRSSTCSSLRLPRRPTLSNRQPASDMPAELIALLIVFVAVLVLGVPVAVCLGLTAIIAIAAIGDVPTGFLVAQRIATGIASFPLLAIPFFILSGLLMGEGGMARRLIDLAAALVGRLPGGLAYVTTTMCMMFGAVSGSAVAAVSSIGSFMVPQMVRKGFGRD